jgi:OOP family OmpA-OmpF porin
MTKSPGPDSSEAIEEKQATGEDGLLELRRLLLGPLQTEVGKLKQRLDDPALHARDVSKILPDAVVLRSGQDGRLATALAPTVEDILESSVKKDPRTLVNALFPVMGPAIRKAIFETLKQMIQSFDQIIGRSFSWQGLKWRIEAFRSGKSFAEVVLLHSLLYRVEQVFLIHKETGLLLQHVVAESEIAREPEMVSGMLTAIQDFVKDSFRTEKEDTLDTIHMGELTIYIEQGPFAVIAGVIRGTPSENLRFLFEETLEIIHLQKRESLESFDGDAAPFETIRHNLESCLQAQYKPRNQRVSPLSLLVTGGVIISLGFWFYNLIHDELRWKAYLEELRRTPGIIVAEAGRTSGNRFISGLRDPLARDPVTLLEEKDIDPKGVIFRWEPYYAINDGFILTRARQLLKPPETVSLTFENGVLSAGGSAHHQWIREFRLHQTSIPGVVQLRENELNDLDFEELAALRADFDKTVVRFVVNSTQLLPDQDDLIQDLLAKVQRLQSLASLVGVGLHIEVIGHADVTGQEAKNVTLSHRRADEILSLLVSKGIEPDLLSAAGVGSSQPVREDLGEESRTFNRSATFRTIMGYLIEHKN